VVWEAATRATCETLLGRADLVRDKVVVELGAGCGVASMVAALACGAARAHVTDADAWLDHARRAVRESAHLRLAADEGRLAVEPLDWSRGAPRHLAGSADVVLAVECVSLDAYGRASLDALLRAVLDVARAERAVVVLCSERRAGDGLDDFLAALRPHVLRAEPVQRFDGGVELHVAELRGAAR